jgi:hypothetical protein
VSAAQLTPHVEPGQQLTLEPHRLVRRGSHEFRLEDRPVGDLRVRGWSNTVHVGWGGRTFVAHTERSGPRELFLGGPFVLRDANTDAEMARLHKGVATLGGRDRTFEWKGNGVGEWVFRAPDSTDVVRVRRVKEWLRFLLVGRLALTLEAEPSELPPDDVVLLMLLGSTWLLNLSVSV